MRSAFKRFAQVAGTFSSHTFVVRPCKLNSNPRMKLRLDHVETQRSMILLVSDYQLKQFAIEKDSDIYQASIDKSTGGVYVDTLKGCFLLMSESGVRIRIDSYFPRGRVTLTRLIE